MGVNKRELGFPSVQRGVEPADGDGDGDEGECGQSQGAGPDGVKVGTFEHNVAHHQLLRNVRG